MNKNVCTIGMITIHKTIIFIDERFIFCNSQYFVFIKSERIFVLLYLRIL